MKKFLIQAGQSLFFLLFLSGLFYGLLYADKLRMLGERLQ